MDKTGSSNKFYITTPIYYVNDKPHIGHTYTTVLSDVLTRFNRLLGKNTFFLTGTDEHGQKVSQAAKREGMTPQEQADKTVVRFKQMWKSLNISYDNFIRTTDEQHKIAVQSILQELFDKEEIYKSEYDGWYCVPDERFFTGKDLVDSLCPECGRKVEKIKETNYFFKMGKYRDWLIEYINKNPEYIQPSFRKNETLGFLKQELNDLCISRPKSRLSWGVELPFDKDYITYVWFDALINYLTGIGFNQNEKEFSKWWPATYHLIGKDILTTHTVYWSIMLKAIGLELPKHIFAHGWWMVEDSKMGKSLGNAVDPISLIKKYGSDEFRYILISGMTIGQDANFSEAEFIKRYNADLANDFGNLVSRIIKLIENNFSGKIPHLKHVDAEDKQLLQDLKGYTKDLEGNILNLRLDFVVKSVNDMVRAVNKYFELTKPWILAKEGKVEKLATVLYNALDIVRIASIVLTPIMPEKMNQLKKVLGLDNSEKSFRENIISGHLKEGTQLGKLKVLFPRIETKISNENTKKTSNNDNGNDLINIEDFKKLDLRTASIITAEKIKDTKKLLKLKVKIGEKEHQLVSGIALEYKPDELIGKEVIVLSNLKPVTIKGVKSEGMILSIVDNDKTILISPDKMTGDGRKIY